MATDMDRGGSFRALHERAFIIPNPYDLGSAVLMERLGFPAVATTSAGFAFTRALPDGAVRFDDMIAHCREVCAAVSIPVSADLEKGKGDSADSAAETVFAAEAAGLAGCSLEDFSGDESAPIYDFDHAVERVAAAAEAARSLPRDFVLTARAENFLHGRPDLDDTIKRLQAFEKAGADVLYAPGLTNYGQVREVCSALSRPVNVLAVDGFTLDGLRDAGAIRISLGSKLATAAFGAVRRAAQEMLGAGSFAFARDGMAFDELQAMFAGGD